MGAKARLFFRRFREVSHVTGTLPINLGSLNDVAREVNKVSPELAQKLLNAPYDPEKDFEQNTG